MQKSLPQRWDWMSVILLTFMLQAAAARLVVTDWTDFLILAQSLATLGTILGIALGYSQFKRKTVLALIAGYSITLIPWQMTLAIKGDLFSEKLISVGGRLWNALKAIAVNEPLLDGLPFVIFIATVLWLIGIASGYWYVRHNNFLVGVLPGQIFLLIIHQYDPYFPKRNWLQGAYLLLGLMLLGRYYYLQNRESWQRRRVFQVLESSFDITRGLVLAAAIFVFLAWNLPTPLSEIESAKQAWDTFTKPWELLQERLSNAVKPLQSPSNPSNPDFYGSQLPLGIGNPLEDTIVFAVRPDDDTLAPPRYYWRGYVYDIYFSNRWYTRTIRTESFFPTKGNIPALGIDQGHTATFTYSVAIEQGLVYAASQPTWISREANTKTFILEEGEQDLTAFYATPPILPGEQYRTRAVLIDPSIQELMAAGSEYPEWVTNRYLTLPEEFSPRIAELAAEITQGLDTPYDKTSAITAYLRSEIKYANPLPETPPADVDVLEWILFDLKQGFCNYYASAEVLMLRSLGIPARIAVGFSEGTYDAENEVYFIRYYNAHAWPEIYFPGIGWVEFEPTANQDPLIRPNRPTNITIPTPRAPDNFLPLDEEPTPPPLQGIDLDEPTGPIPLNLLLTYALYLSTIIALVVLFIFINQRYAVMETLPLRLQSIYERNGGQAPSWVKNWARWNTLTGIQRSFETINRSLRLLGETPAISNTPAERAHKLTELLPQAASHVENLSNEHQTSLFTQTAGDARKAKRASLMIRLRTLQARIQKVRARLSNRYK